MKKLLVLLVLLSGWVRAAEAESLEFKEAFAWGDRSRALAMLVPNTEDFYHYTALHHQLSGDRAAFEATMQDWRAFLRPRSPSARYQEMERRQALLEFGRMPADAWSMIRNHLNLRFHHRPRDEERVSVHPSRIGEAVYGLEAFLREARVGNRIENNVTDEGLEILLRQALSPEQRRVALSRLRRPDVPDLVSLIVEDLGFKDSQGFGQHAVHGLLTKEQLEELGRRMPGLLRDRTYVEERLARMPAPETDLSRDHEAAVRHFTEVWDFVKGLEPMHNSLKASVLYRLLDHQRHLGRYDEGLFRVYLDFPRQVSYLPRERMKALQRRRSDWVNFSYRPQVESIVLPPIGNEEELVRDFLMVLLRRAATSEAFAGWFERKWLDAVFAESKILHGIGRPEEWRGMLTPEQYRAILERVELEFARVNPAYLSPGEAVELKVDVKRVESLLIKVYELQSFNYYSTRRQPVDQAVDLDGLVATHERTLKVEQTPGRRVRHTLAFPEITERGVYVVELIGGGVSSRALLHVGHLESISQSVDAGQAVMVLNEAGDHVTSASLWMDGREFTANERGVIFLPFSENPGPRFAVLRDGNFSFPEEIMHLGENHTFSAGIHLDPQNLPRRNTAVLVLRPDFRVNGVPLDPALLEDVRVTLGATDARETRTERHFTAEFTRNREWRVSFYVPDDLRNLDVRVEAGLRRRTDGERITLSDEAVLGVNQARTGALMRQAFLVPAREGWAIEVRGLTGEPIAGVPLRLGFHHAGFRRRVPTHATTDEAGRAFVGSLAQVQRITAESPDMVGIDQTVPFGRVQWPERLNVLAGEAVSLPYPFEAHRDLKAFSLLRTARGKVQEDLAGKVQIDSGQVSVEGLAAGSYELRLHPQGQVVRIEVLEGESKHGYLLGARRRLQETVAKMSSLVEVEQDGDRVHVQLRHVTPSTRVAVRAARFAGPGAAFPAGSGFPSPAERRFHPPHVQYVSGRNIGDEYRYVLERRFQEIFAGTLLARPGLILNPWELRETTAEREQLKADQAYRGGRQQLGRAPSAPAPAQVRSAARLRVQRTVGPQDIGVDFLPQGSVWWTNLVPDEQGRVSLDRSELGEQTWLEVVVMDRFGTSQTTVLMEDRAFDPVDVRLLAGLDAEQSFSRQKRIRALAAGEDFEIPDLATSRYRVIRTLPEAFDLLQTLGDEALLRKFTFLKEWPELEAEQKREKYGEFASHELHLFLYARDREFFDGVVKPYLANKKDKTFVDRWLLEALTEEDTRLDRLQERNAMELALLARRGGDREAVLGALREAWELLPPDADGFARRVRVALQSADLDEAIAGERDSRRRDAEGLSELMSDVASPAVMSGVMAGRVSHMRHADGFGAAPAAESAPAPRRAMAMSLREESVAEMAEMADMEVLGDPFGDGDPFGAPPMFRALPKTKEWAEQNYYTLRVKADTPERIRVNGFWRDVAEGVAVSSHVLEAHGNLTEVLVALAFCGLPWEAEEVAEEVKGARLAGRVEQPALLVSEQIQAAEVSEDDRPLLISQQFYRPDDRYRYEGNEQIEKFVSGEFVRRVVYGGRVTLTNPTASRRRLNVLVQLPRGAVPVNNGFYTDDASVVLEPYTTQTIEYFFMFPFAGQFSQFPAHAAADEAIIGRADSRVFAVVDAPTEFDPTSWGWIAQHAEPDAVVAFLKENNLRRLNLDEMAWRLRDRAFFVRAADVLASRLVLHDTTFAYSVYHEDVDRTRMWLSRTPLAERVGPVMDSVLLRVDPVERKSYEHLEYDPLVNPRAHRVGERREILNPAVREQYTAFLNQAIYREELNAAERLGLVYYLVLQDRLSEAIAQLDRVRDGEETEKLQVVYLRAWLDLRTLDVDRALAGITPYLAHDVPRWRARFEALRDAVDEAKGAEAVAAADPDRQQRLDRAAAESPSLSMRQEGGRIWVTARNMPQATLNLYPMDVELLFSRRPFAAAGGDGFGIVKPALRREIALRDDGEEFELELPRAFRDRNVVVELTGRGLRESETWFANRLRVRMMESFGQVEVRSSENGQPLPKTYVKVYAQGMDGKESFWKDGYTDLRGRFDYLSLNDRQPEEAVRFSILIEHPEHGSMIREAVPPTR